MITAVLALIYVVLAGAIAALAPARRVAATGALLLAVAAVLPMHAPCTLAGAVLVLADGMRIEAALPLLAAAGVGLAAIAAPGAAAAIAGSLAALLVTRVVREAFRHKVRAHTTAEAGARTALALALATELAGDHRLASTARAGALALAASLGLLTLALTGAAHASAAKLRASSRQRRARGVNAGAPDRTVTTDGLAASRAPQAAELAPVDAQSVAQEALADALRRIVHELRQPIGAASNALAAATLPGTEPALADDLRTLASTEIGAALAELETLARLARVGVGERLRLPATDAVTIALGAHADSVRFLPGFEGALEVDPSQLAHALEALVRNAREACDAPPVRVETTAPTGDVLRVRVVDAGPAPAADVLARATDPFFTTRAGRLGIGATQAAAFARAMGGTLELRREGPYTVAELALPLARP